MARAVTNSLGYVSILILGVLASGPARTQDEASTPQPVASTESVERPNIVLFLVDDLGWQDTSVPFHDESTPFNRLYRTPNMERLAATGVRFSQAYAYSLCSPTRTSLMTGWNAARHHVTQWTLRPGRDPSQKAGGMQSPGWNLDGLQPGTPTLPAILREHGYRTIHAGKAHFGALGTPGADPLQLGFDVNIAGHCAGGPGSYHGQHDYSAAWRNGDRIWDVPGLDDYHGTETNLTDALTIEALEAVEEAVEQERPFYLYLSHYAVHAPLEAHEPYVQEYLARGMSRPEAIYASMIEGMDASLGAVLEKLEQLEVSEETLILFASDNGGLAHGPRGRTPMDTGHYTHNAPLRSGKSSAYEGGMRVPLIVTWARPSAVMNASQNAATTVAGRMQAAYPIPSGERRTALAHCDDWLPTICGMAGVEDLSARVQHLDGIDLRDAILAASAPEPERALVFHYPHFINYGKNTIQHGYGPFSAIRLGRWKAIYFYDRGVWELYDLEADLGEQHDLAASEPERLQELARSLQAKLQEYGAQYPVMSETGREVDLRLP